MSTEAQAQPYERLGQIREQIAGERTVSRPLNDALILDALEALADATAELVAHATARLAPAAEPEPAPDPQQETPKIILP